MTAKTRQVQQFTSLAPLCVQDARFRRGRAASRAFNVSGAVAACLSRVPIRLIHKK